MGKLAKSYFDTMFTTSNPTGLDEILTGLLPTVIADMNNSLNKPYNAEEVLKALHQMAPFVAPGPDVFDSQSAFLSGRLITDNVLVAFETLHFLKRKTQGKDEYMALKLDMSKAYDRVEWDFLERAMLHLGLARSYVATIMSCIKSVSYSVLLNGVLGRTIKPSRGLRQGDPLSPYLFLICAMGLQGLLHKAESNGAIRGVSICRNGPRVSHLFFDDDSVLFYRAKESECQVFSEVARLLRDFLEAHDDAPVIVQNLVRPKWSTPAQPRYKANFNGVLFKSTDLACLGMIIRDTNGTVIGALSARVPLPQSVAMVEALACRRAVQFVVEIGLHEVIFEGDAAIIINAISNGSANQSLYGHIVDVILAQASLLYFFEFCFVPCSCITVADALAKCAKVGSELQVWLEDCPEDIAPLVLGDAS
ncbi:hypothetical protein SO802_010941 [Lithocarpus litseifolius]|uniref:Reverse transcriptase domain-containing protein n=1 Tax=Lithocarpus litseifolius TaxID=425828 RepID=A0AAW2DH28_9ROSI